MASVSTRRPTVPLIGNVISCRIEIAQPDLLFYRQIENWSQEGYITTHLIPENIKRGWSGRFGEMKIQILLTIKNHMIKMIVFIVAGNIKEQSNDLKNEIVIFDG